MNRIDPLLASPALVSYPLTMADVMARVEANPELPKRRRGELLSAVRSLCRVLDMEPVSVSADIRSLRERLDKLPLAHGGLSRQRWNNVKSLVLAALAAAGIKTMAGRADQPLSPAWDALKELLAEPDLRIGLSRFMGFCSARGIPPDGVDAHTFDLFQQALEDESLVRDVANLGRDCRGRWNKAATAVAGWPAFRVEVPVSSRFYSLPWDSFPPSLLSEVEAFLTRSGSPNPFADDFTRAARPGTVQQRRKQLQQLASALVLSGFPIERVTGLAALVEVSNAKAALKFYWDRAGGLSSLVIHGKALLLAAIAKHQVKAPEPQVQQLVQLAENLRVEKGGMTSKNRERLRQFDDDANVDALLNLPYRVFQEVRRNPVGDRQEALRVMHAVTVELLVMAPMRIDNMAGLEIGRNIVRTRPGRAGVVHVVLPEETVKNTVAYEAELPKETADLLAAYIKTYRPRIAAAPSPWLFPNDEGGRRVTGSFSTGLSAFILRETGLTMNAHLFRHFAATLYLAAHPDDLETARRILGHKSLTTTMRFYAEMKAKQAFERYGAMIAARRNPGRTPPPFPSRPAKRGTGK